MTTGEPPALISIHDVMPETLDDVSELLHRFAELKLPMPALLVVPGRDWRDDQLQRLRQWQHAGAELIAHGWVHVTRPQRLYHRLHSLLLSRNVAEHLALDPAGIVELMQRSHDWFTDVGLSPPQSYIPPAWALGIPPERLCATPYHCVEVLNGALLRKNDSFVLQPLPLNGFEADTSWRALFLRYWNQRQRRRARQRQTPLRIAIHPQDHRLRLSKELDHILRQPWQRLRYADLASR